MGLLDQQTMQHLVIEDLVLLSRTDQSIDHFVRSIASRNSWATYRTTDFTSEEGRVLPWLHLSTSQGTSSNSTKLKIWLQGAVHGNEPAGDQALLALLGAMDANQTWTASLLEKMDITILPRYNPDGVAYFQRTLATNFDPNRDHTKLARQFTRDIKSLFIESAPHIVVDMHEFGAATRYGGNYVHSSDALFSAAKNLNIHQEIRSLSEDLFAKDIGKALDSMDLRWEPYVTGSSNSTPNSTIRFAEAGSDAKIGRNAMGLTQTVTFLFEMRGIALADQEFQRRTVTGLTMLLSVLNTAADNAELVYSTIQGGIERFKSSNSDIVITDSTASSTRPFRMIDTRNGSIVSVPVQFSSTTPTKANLTRARPEAYLIPSGWSDLAERLKDGGLTVTTLRQPFQGIVETYNVTSVQFDRTYYEGVVPVTVSTSIQSKELGLPVGSFYISTRQRNAGFAFVTLEPENIDSFVSLNIIAAEVGDELPIYRIPIET